MHLRIEGAQRVSKVDNILAEELGPDDGDPTPRGGGSSGSRWGCSVRLPVAGLAVAAAVAVFVGLLDAGAGVPVWGPAPTAAEVGPAVSATCAEPASWCRWPR
jgi:hypothetical protein